MFVDLDWPLNASSLLSASAELLVCLATLWTYILGYQTAALTIHTYSYLAQNNQWMQCCMSVCVYTGYGSRVLTRMLKCARGSWNSQSTCTWLQCQSATSWRRSTRRTCARRHIIITWQHQLLRQTLPWLLGLCSVCLLWRLYDWLLFDICKHLHSCYSTA